MLRFQPEIGAGLASPLVRYLTLPVVPVQLGFDPRLQLLDAEDATAALVAAVRNPVRGPVNVAPDGAISLSRALRLLRRPGGPAAGPRLRGAHASLRGRARRRRAATATGSGCCATAAASTTAACARSSAIDPRRDARAPRSARVAQRSRAWDVPAAAGSVSATRRAEAIAEFLRGLRGGVESGLDPLAAAQQAAGSLPQRLALGGRGARPAPAGRLPRGRVGIRRGLRRGGVPALRAPLRDLVAGRGRRAS